MEDVQKLEERLKGVRNRRERKDLEDLISIEKEYRSTKNISREELFYKKKIIREQLDLMFLINEDENEEGSNSTDSEYGDEIHDKIFSMDDKCDSKNKLLVDSGQNDYL